MRVCLSVLLTLTVLAFCKCRCPNNRDYDHGSLYDDVEDSYLPYRRPRSIGSMIARMARIVNRKFKEIDFRLDDLRQISSCAGRCSEEIPGATCQCHHNCGTEENCCSDFVYECDRTCEDICDTAFDERFACQCDSECALFVNCCSDYAKLCSNGTDASDDMMQATPNPDTVITNINSHKIPSAKSVQKPELEHSNDLDDGLEK